MMMPDKFTRLAEAYELATRAAEAHDDQAVLTQLYYLRELAWDINATILARRWEAHQATRISRRRTFVPTTIDDLMA